MVKREDLHTETFRVTGRCSKVTVRRASSLTVRVKNRYVAQILIGILTYKATVCRKQQWPHLPLHGHNLHGSPVTRRMSRTSSHRVGSSKSDVTEDLTLHTFPLSERKEKSLLEPSETVGTFLTAGTFAQQA